MRHHACDSGTTVCPPRPLPLLPTTTGRSNTGTATSAELPPPPPREILDAAGELLRALAAPVRIAIVLQLRESQRCVHELVDALGVPQPLVSQH